MTLTHTFSIRFPEEDSSDSVTVTQNDENFTPELIYREDGNWELHIHNTLKEEQEITINIHGFTRGRFDTYRDDEKVASHRAFGSEITTRVIPKQRLMLVLKQDPPMPSLSPEAEEAIKHEAVLKEQAFMIPKEAVREHLEAIEKEIQRLKEALI